ncbi:putative ATPase (ISW2-like) [Hordeum vulgare]|nr:putative ATPase (ISW2-like) [Hordeum vulgare]
MSTTAGGPRIDLATADVVFLYDSHCAFRNPEDDLRGQERSYRRTQNKDEVQVFRFITKDNIKEHVFERAQKKLSTSDSIYGRGGVKGGRGREGRTSRSEEAQSMAEEEGEETALSSPIIGGRHVSHGGGGPRSSEGGGED